MIKRGVALLTYNRAPYLKEVLDGLIKTLPPKASFVVCDDGSTDETSTIMRNYNFNYIRGRNLGVGANKNRALYALKDCHFIALVEDDLIPTGNKWFDIYEQVCMATNIHHFCRVQDKEVIETVPDFTKWLQEHKGFTPIYGPSPRGDFTFISQRVIKEIGAFHPRFKGAGYAHGEWSNRVAKAGLIPHPLKWIDIKEARDMFVQKGDTEGGRWMASEKKIKQELRRNAQVRKDLERKDYIHHPIFLP